MSLDRVNALQEIGIEIFYETEWVGEGKDRHQIETDKIRGFNFPWSPEDWCYVAMRESDGYVGGCCGNMSMLQDHINAVFRDGGWCDGHHFATIGTLAEGHDGFEEFLPMDDETFARWVSQWKSIMERGDRTDPWKTLGIIWNAVKGHLSLTSTEVPRNKYKHESEEKFLVSDLADSIQRLDWHDFFKRDDPNEKSGHEAQRRLLYAKVLPTMHRLCEKIEALDPSFDGFAIVKPGTEEILTSGRGSCIYLDREAAQYTLGLWADWAVEEKERNRRGLEIRKERGEDVEEFSEETFWQEHTGEIREIHLRNDGEIEFR